MNDKKNNNMGKDINTNKNKTNGNKKSEKKKVVTMQKSYTGKRKKKLIIKLSPDPNSDMIKIWRNEVYDKYKSMKSLNDLIDLSRHVMKQKRYVYTLCDKIYLFINDLKKISDDLEDLNKLIGMNNVKELLFRQLIYILKDLHDKENNFLNTVIYGSPGLGKSQLIDIIANIYSNLGICRYNHNIVRCRRSDLVGEYLGQTAVKTQKMINKARDGILVIDEAYSIGGKENNSYSKECIDTLNQNLTENRNFICILAGYEECINKYFFQMNQGLDRRFPFRIKIETYSALELREMFIQKIIMSNFWKIKYPIEDSIPLNWFDDKMKYFNNYGGDIENLFMICKMEYSIFSLENDLSENIESNIFDKKLINLSFEKYKNTLKTKILEKDHNSFLQMYL